MRVELSIFFKYILDIGSNQKTFYIKTTLVGMKGWSPFYFDGGFLIYTIMTYKFYDQMGSEMEVFKNYEKEKITIYLQGDGIQSIDLDLEDVEDLIFVLEKLTNKNTITWKTLSNN
jgi:hypothetical protein